MDYFAIKTVHQAAVTLSFLGFLARGVGRFSGAAWVNGRSAKTVPHVIDTVLLASAIALAWALRLNPITTPWLAAKIIALLVYIGLGMVAFGKRAGPRVSRLAWIFALATFGLIVSVAITKNPLGVLVWLI